MGNTLITISRQHGSGGTKVAQILAEKLGIWYYNREILYIAADKIGYDSLNEKSMDEINYKKASKYMEGLSIMTGSRNHIPVYNQMFKEHYDHKEISWVRIWRLLRKMRRLRIKR